MSLWIVPGAPLEGGKGWRVWFSHEGEGTFAPPTVAVSQHGVPQDVTFSWKLLPSLKGLKRRMGVLTVTLRSPAPETGGEYEFHISGTGLSHHLRWRSLPKKVGSDGTAFFLASCFWHDDDREGIYASKLKELTKLHHPAFKLLVGDQVYLDWPNDWTTGDDGIELYGKRYAQYWGDEAYREALAWRALELTPRPGFVARYQRGDFVARETRRYDDFETAEGFDQQFCMARAFRNPQLPVQRFLQGRLRRRRRRGVDGIVRHAGTGWLIAGPV